MERLPEGTPAGLEALIARCLVKDPRNRLRDIGDARLQLEEATVRRADSANDAAPARTLLLRRRRPWGFWLALPVVAVTAAALAWYARPSAPAPLVRLSIALPQGDQAVTVPAISPDGQVVAYAAGRTPATSRLYVRRLDEVAAREVAGSVAAQYPFFSADGRTVAFFADGKLRRAPVTGGGAIDIAAAPSAWGGTWGPDGWIVYVPSLPAGLWRVRAEGGNAEQLTKPDGAAAGYAHVFPQSVAGSNDLTFGYWGQTFYTAFFSPAGRTWRKITPPLTTQGLFVGVYARSGHVIAGDVAGGVRAAEWTPAATAPVNPETVVLDNVYWELSIERPWLNVAENGTAVYVPGNPSSRHLVWVDRQGQATRLPGDADQILRATVSRNGRRVVYDGNRSTEWVIDLATGTRTRIVSNVRSWHGGWLPGDDRLVVSSNKDGDWDLYTVGTSGNDRLEPLLRQPFNQFAQAVTADGTIVYAEDHPVTGSDLRTLAPDGRTSALLVTPFNEMSASLSADDRFMAYVSDEGGVYDVYAIAASGKGPRVQISLDGGTGPLWSRDGRELFYRVGGDLVSVDVQTTGALVVGARHKVLDVSEYDAGFLHEFDVSADGKRFLLIQTDADARPTRLDVILNWFGELKRKVAAR
jgi:eukaryotic-like serine/threonine-protein kinase